MVGKSHTQKVSLSIIGNAPKLSSYLFLEVETLAEEKKRGQITIERKKKKREIFEEQGHQTNVPPDVSDEEKKALDQTGEDATSGW